VTVSLPDDALSLPMDLDVVRAIADELAIVLDYIQIQTAERERLRRYARDITQAQEDERRRVARDLHDEAAQALVVLSRRLRRLGESDEVTRSGALEAGSLRTMADEIQNSIRLTSGALRPSLLDDLGLAAALESLVSDLAASGRADVSLAIRGDDVRLDPGVKLAAFRIAQEALRNADHHADAGHIAVELECDDGTLFLGISDDGRGFDPAAMDLTGLGLMGMRERTELAGGSLTIDSAPDRGTRVVFRVPAV